MNPRKLRTLRLVTINQTLSADIMYNYDNRIIVTLSQHHISTPMTPHIHPYSHNRIYPSLHTFVHTLSLTW